MNKLVKLLTNDDGQKQEPLWHLIDPANETGPSTLCSGEFFGYGESSCTYELKSVKRGGITCLKCTGKLKTYKAVRLA